MLQIENWVLICQGISHWLTEGNEGKGRLDKNESVITVIPTILDLKYPWMD